MKTKEPLHRYKIYHLQELPLEKMVEMYYAYSQERHLQAHRDVKISQGIEMYIHLIARNEIASFSNDEGEFTGVEMNAYVLRYVIGDVYEDIHKFLLDSGIVERSEYYVTGASSYIYRINPEYKIIEWWVNYAYPSIYYERLRGGFAAYKKMLDKKAPKNKGDKDEWEEPITSREEAFRKQYENTLKKVKLTDDKALGKYIDEYDFICKEDIKNKNNKIIHRKGEYHYEKELSYRYNHEALREKEKSVYKWDKYGRIHHCITNCPREFREYINIWFERDIHNAQPLLIVTFLYEYYGLDYNSIRNLSRWLSPFTGDGGELDSKGGNIHKEEEEYYNNVLNLGKGNSKEVHHYDACMYDIPYSSSFPTYHYDACFEHKIHIDSELRKSLEPIKNLPADVYDYISLTMTGKLWDVLCEMFNESRNEIKETMFEELFYSKKKQICRWQKHAQAFQERFPNVTKTILAIRNNHSEDDAWLPKEMQRRESRLMRNVLSQLFEKGYDVVSIHDAVLMLDTKKNRKTPLHLAKTDVEYTIYQAAFDSGLGCSLGS